MKIWLDAFKTTLKNVNTEKPTGDLNGNKITDKITRTVLDKSGSANRETDCKPKVSEFNKKFLKLARERYIQP